MIKEYENYHKHDSISNIFTPDTHIKTIDYINRIKKLGYGCYYTTNHGSGGDVFESLTLCRQNNIRCLYGIEGYIVKNPLEKDKRNYHIVIIPVDNVARKKVNLIVSKANIEGFYYKPRFFIEDLLKLNPNEVYITTACVAGILKNEDSIKNIFIPLMQHFGKNLFLEVQNHCEETQITTNKKCLLLSKKFNLKLIAANDSHYIYPEQAKDRLNFLKGKGIDYGNEDNYLLDFPDYDTMFNRFKNQGVLTNEQIIEAMANTLIFRNCEDIDIDKNIKMPSIYPNFTPDEKINELKKHIAKKFKVIAKQENIIGDELNMYKRGIVDEMKVIEDTKEINTADYFLLNEKLVDLAVNKYNGVLTKTGRGSCGGFYINKILGMTQLDRFKLDIKLYPERFMSTARLLENHALPDIDYNVVSQEPFVKAAKELLGEYGCYPMIAYGTMQIGEAFRNVCRTHGLEYDEYNEIAKEIENYINDNKWKPFIDEANKYVDTVVSASIHPCAYLLDNKNLQEEYGVVRIGDNICAMITSGEADEYKMLKDDFLLVTVYKLIDETFKLIGKPIITVKELFESLNDNIWDIFEKGLTCTLNQVDGDWATSLLKKFKPKTISDMAMFVACLRPFFEPWRDGFIKRDKFSTGSSYLDKILTSTKSYIIFQENLMQYFEWLGVTPAESIGLIKKISKKKIHPEDFRALENRIKIKWIENTGSIDNFDETWSMIQSCMAYGFCSAHAVATAVDSLYGAYLKANYPLEYYTVALSNYADDTDRTHKLVNELSYFNIKLLPIKFGKSSSEYTMDKETNSIYKGIESIKYCNSKIAEELLELSKQKDYKTFIELLDDITAKTSINSRQLEILIGLNFFSDFGNNKYLLNIYNLYNGIKEKGKTILPSFRNCSVISKKNIDNYSTYGLSEYLVKKYSNKETQSQYREIDNIGLLSELCNKIENKSMNVVEQMKFEKEYLQYIEYINPKISDNYYVVIDFKTYKNSTQPYLIVRNISSGEELKTRIKRGNIYKSKPFGEFSILKIYGFIWDFKRKKVGDDWIITDEKEPILEEYEVIKNEE
ncbi:MAG: PHP domain-containing protein [Clostridia bacterium]